MISRLTPAAAGTPETPQAAKLRKGAQEFEAMMLQQLWKGLRQEDEGGPHGTLTDLSMQALSQGLAARGGLGIAKMIQTQLK